MKPVSYNVSNNQWSSIFVKFSVCFLLMGLFYSLSTSSFVQFGPSAFTDLLPDHVRNTDLPPSPVMHVGNQTSQNVAEKCDIFKGDWIEDPTGSPYTNNTCSTIEKHQNCVRNGRPDTDYIYWRWKPRDCDLPKFDAIKFLDLMRNKSLAFIGDSIMRNHVQSLLCTLSQVAEATQVYHDKEYHSRRWYIPLYDFTLSVIWSPFLTKATILEDDNGVSYGLPQIHVDELDSVWTQQYQNFDYILIAGGKWFLKTAIYYENNKIVGCHNCHDKNITEVGFDFAYKKALNSVLSYIIQSKHKAYTFFRTTTPDHFENGEWDTGGYCNRTRPFKEGEVDLTVVDQILRRIELEVFDKVSGDGTRLKLFDTTALSLLRPDGHPGVYREFQPYANNNKNVKIQNDCLHWCLPGPIDSWNDLMLELLHTA